MTKNLKFGLRTPIKHSKSRNIVNAVTLGLIMKREITKYQFLSVTILMIVISSCFVDKKNVLIEVEGPFYGADIIQQFGLDSFPFNIHSKDIYIAKLINNSESIVSIETSAKNQIFPDSSWYHTYLPYSAEKRSWNQIRQDKPKKDTFQSRLKPKESKLFWFSSYYDDYVDSMSIHFTLLRESKKEGLIVYESYDMKEKPMINYELIETTKSMKFADEVQIEINVEGPFTYKETNTILNVNIPYTTDSKEVFIFDIKNKRQENLYIEKWSNDEISIDTIYSFSPFTQTAKEYLWILGTSNKVTIPTDTIILKPQENYKFWDSYFNIWPTTDSIAFNETFRTDKYLIEWFKLFEVKKN